MGGWTGVGKAINEKAADTATLIVSVSLDAILITIWLICERFPVGWVNRLLVTPTSEDRTWALTTVEILNQTPTCSAISRKYSRAGLIECACPTTRKWSSAWLCKMALVKAVSVTAIAALLFEASACLNSLAFSLAAVRCTLKPGIEH